MKVIRHENPSERKEIGLLPRLRQGLYKAAAEAFREKKGRAPIGAGSEELQFPFGPPRRLRN